MPEQLTVTAEDREAWCDYEDFDDAFRTRVMLGWEDTTFGLRSFAAHRIKALEQAAGVAMAYPFTDQEHSNQAVCFNASQAIADAIRALKDTSHD